MGAHDLKTSRLVWNHAARRYFRAVEPPKGYAPDNKTYDSLPEYEKDFFRACAQREFNGKS